MIPRFKVDLRSNKLVRVDVKNPRRDTESRRKAGVKPRVKAIGGGKTAPVGEYKDRKDIGSTKARSEREQQPTKERGSAEVKQSYADKVKAERKKAAQARIAAKKSGGEVKKTETKKNTDKEASQLLKKKETKKVNPNYKTKRSVRLYKTRTHEDYSCR